MVRTAAPEPLDPEIRAMVETPDQGSSAFVFPWLLGRATGWEQAQQEAAKNGKTLPGASSGELGFGSLLRLSEEEQGGEVVCNSLLSWSQLAERPCKACLAVKSVGRFSSVHGLAIA